MRLLISGYRDFKDKKMIEEYMVKILPNEKNTVIHGGCKGVDLIAGEIAKKYNWDVEVYNPNWSLGLKAGPLRNERMIVEGYPDIALLFLSKESKGTLNMLNLCKKYKVKHEIVNI